MALPTLPPPPMQTPWGGPIPSTWARWFQLLQAKIVDALHPTTAAGLSQAGAVYQGTGAPSNADGNNGDVYFRTDTPGTANQRLYVKAAGAWTGLL